ncbi:MAG: hypothetical protein IPI49_32070 [Myxococcales bacterium]|nr:hypothetical protein [Myxococcales bacterium]
MDWAINDRHRLSFNYQRTKGNVINPTVSSDTNLPLSSNWYNANDTLNTAVLRLFSDWTDKLSHRVRGQRQAGGQPATPAQRQQVRRDERTHRRRRQHPAWPDEFRHANRLDNGPLSRQGPGHLPAGRPPPDRRRRFDRLMVDNLFVAASRGVATYNSIADFEALRPSSLRYNNALTRISTTPREVEHRRARRRAGSVRGHARLTLQGGVRVEAYQAASQIKANALFRARHGFSNNATLDGRYSLLPRAGAKLPRGAPPEPARRRGPVRRQLAPTVWSLQLIHQRRRARGHRHRVSAARLRHPQRPRRPHHP